MKPKQPIFLSVVIALLLSFLLMQPLRAGNEAAADMNDSYFGLSAETNSLKSGIFIEGTNRMIVIKQGKMTTKAYLAMLNTSSNSIYFYWPKSIGQRLDLNMVNSNGIAVAKTAKGKQLGQSLDLPKETPVWVSNHKGLMKEFVPPRMDILYTWANLTAPEKHFVFTESLPECFQLKQPGDYKLALSQRIYIADTNGFLKPVIFPPVTIDVRVEGSNK